MAFGGDFVLSFKDAQPLSVLMYRWFGIICLLTLFMEKWLIRLPLFAGVAPFYPLIYYDFKKISGRGLKTKTQNNKKTSFIAIGAHAHPIG